MLDPRIATFIRRMPKVELHVHLEGSIKPRTLLDLAERNGVSLPATDLAGIERFFRYDDFLGFLKVFMLCARTLSHGEDFERLTYEVLCDAARQEVRYTELFISAMQYRLRGLDFDELLQGVEAGRARARRDTGIESGIMFDHGRQFGASEAISMAEVAVAGRRYGVVAFSIGGDEVNYPTELFAEAFEVARRGGLALNAHAGEAAGPESVRAAITSLGAARIGHGIRSIEDPALVAELRDRRIVLDICPTSNLRTGVVRSLAEHPLRRLYDAGVPITINSDDPTLFATSLTDELLLVAEAFGFSTEQLCGLTRTAVEGSFLPTGQRAALLARVAAEQAALRNELGV